MELRGDVGATGLELSAAAKAGARCVLLLGRLAMKKKPKSKWQAVLPTGVRPGDLSLAQLRDAKRVHEFLTEDIRAPEEIAYYIRSFRFLLFFGVACIHENKYPPLTACWNDLDERFMHDPYFDDELFVQSWILIDFPFGPDGQTALDYFQTFLSGGDTGAQFERFIHAARRSRLGLHQDVMHTKQHAKVRELFTGDINELFPSAPYERGEILLVRLMPYRQGGLYVRSPQRLSQRRAGHDRRHGARQDVLASRKPRARHVRTHAL